MLTVEPEFATTKMTTQLEFPELLTAKPAEVAEGIYQGVKKWKNTIYIKPIWRVIMSIIIHLPEFISKRTRLLKMNSMAARFLTGSSDFTSKSIRILTFILNLATAGIFTFCFFLLALNSAKGLDITDRSYHILWAAQPENVTGAATHFGFVTGLLYGLVGENIAAFRLSGLLVLLAVASVFAHSFLRYWNEKFTKRLLPTTFTLSALVATVAYYRSWLNVPNYNWLAVIGVMLTLSGLFYFFIFNLRRCSFYAAVILVSVGGCLSFIAKPTAAVILAILSVIWVAANQRDVKGLIFLLASSGFAATLLLLFAIINFGSVSGYINNLMLGVELRGVLGGGHTLMQSTNSLISDSKSFVEWWVGIPYVLHFLGMMLGVSCLYCFFHHLEKVSEILKFVFIAVILIYFAWFVYCFHFHLERLFVSTILLSVLGCFYIVWIYVITEQIVSKSSDQPDVFSVLFLTCFFLGASLSTAFGTANNVIQQLSNSAVFITISLSIMFHVGAPKKLKELTLASFGVLLAIMGMLFLLKAYEDPYRLAGSIWEQNKQVSFANSKHRLYLDSPTAYYALELLKSAFEAGWQRGTPLIDMTGGSPGALVILDARIVGTPWLLGAYEGSNAFTKTALKSVDQKILNRAWVLTAPEGRRRIDLDVLDKNNLNFPDQYEKVGKLKTGHRNEEQLLWKPTT